MKVKFYSDSIESFGKDLDVIPRVGDYVWTDYRRFIVKVVTFDLQDDEVRVYIERQ